ncbi:MAG: D-glycerate dehydrogenase [Proteobacteria bacterium]|nr:MAG: D-glycerate dehydrogenase [Pseudomonadota bacterium]
MTERIKIVVTDPLPGDLAPLAALGACDHLDLAQSKDPSAALRKACAGASAILTLLSRRVDAGIMDAAGPQLKIVANYAVGFDNINLAAASERGVWVSNTPDVLTEATADITWALVLGIARRVVEGDRMVRAGGFHGWGASLLLGAELTGKTLGIIGFGSIGQAVARRALGFGMRVAVAARPNRPAGQTSPISLPGVGEAKAEVLELDDLLARSHVVSLHCPLTAETRHLLNAERLDRMRDDAFLINTARGPVVDEAALVERLRDGRLRGAGFDVYEHEPQLSEGLAELDNVVLLPHVGSGTVETRREMVAMAIANIRAALAGERPPNAVNERR